MMIEPTNEKIRGSTFLSRDEDICRLYTEPSETVIRFSGRKNNPFPVIFTDMEYTDDKKQNHPQYDK